MSVKSDNRRTRRAIKRIACELLCCAAAAKAEGRAEDQAWYQGGFMLLTKHWIALGFAPPQTAVPKPAQQPRRIPEALQVLVAAM